MITNTNRKIEFNSLTPVFPRYIFVQLHSALKELDSYKVNFGVSNIVMFSDKVTSIPNDIIALMKDKLNAVEAYQEDVSRVDYKKGDFVCIKGGKFAGIEAIFLSKKSKDRVRLLLKLLNTSVVAEMKTSDLGKKEVIKNFKF